MSLPALKQKTTPAPLQRPYRDFDTYVEAAKRFNDLCDKLQDEIGYRDERLTPKELEHYKRLVVKWDQAFYECLAGYKVYESDEFYQKTETAKYLLDPDYETDRQIRRQFVGEKIGFLIGSFPNAGPHNPEIYVAMLIEEIVAANPSASALEATCRQIRRTATFVPTLAEVLKILRAGNVLGRQWAALFYARKKGLARGIEGTDAAKDSHCYDRNERSGKGLTDRSALSKKGIFPI